MSSRARPTKRKRRVKEKKKKILPLDLQLTSHNQPPPPPPPPRLMSLITKTIIFKRTLTTKFSTEEAKKQAAAQLAIQSLKDFGSLLSNSSEDTQPIDTQPIYNNPELFALLSLLHQGQVIKELQDKFDKDWLKLTLKDKKLSYYIAYGNWGVREKFINWNNPNEPPLDLPFKLPTTTIIKSRNPADDVKTKTIIKKLPMVNLNETEVRKEQFDIKRMDGVTKFFIYLMIFISLLAIARDKNIGENGKPEQIIIEDKYEIQRQERLKKKKEEEEEEKEKERLRIELEEKRQFELAKKNKKWYYLWLK